MMLPGKSHKQLLQLLQLLHLLHSDLPDRKHPSGAQHSRHEPEVLLSDLEVDSLPEPGRLPHLPPAGGDQEGVLQMAGGSREKTRRSTSGGNTESHMDSRKLSLSPDCQAKPSGKKYLLFGFF